jgi:hypothetical protein
MTHHDYPQKVGGKITLVLFDYINKQLIMLPSSPDLSYLTLLKVAGENSGYTFSVVMFEASSCQEP